MVSIEEEEYFRQKEEEMLRKIETLYERLEEIASLLPKARKDAETRALEIEYDEIENKIFEIEREKRKYKFKSLSVNEEGSEMTALFGAPKDLVSPFKEMKEFVEMGYIKYEVKITFYQGKGLESSDVYAGAIEFDRISGKEKNVGFVKVDASMDEKRKLLYAFSNRDKIGNITREQREI